MLNETLKKIISLIKKTGDRVVVFDPNNPGDTYVIMDFDRYSAMFSGLEATNVPSSAPERPREQVQASFDSGLKQAEKENLTEEDLTDKINREILMWKNQDNAPYLGEENKPKKPWQIPPQVKEKAQGVE